MVRRRYAPGRGSVMKRWWHRMLLHRQSPWITYHMPRPPRLFWRCSCGEEFDRG